MVYTRVAGPGGIPMQPRIWLCDRLFGFWLSPLNASAAFAFSYDAIWIGVFWLLYRRRVFIKI